MPSRPRLVSILLMLSGVLLEIAVGVLVIWVAVSIYHNTSETHAHVHAIAEACGVPHEEIWGDEMSKSQRTKGAAYEREIVNDLKAAGLQCERNLSQTRDSGGDIELSYMLLECKRWETKKYTAAINQASANAAKLNKRPVLVERASREKSVYWVPMTRDEFVDFEDEDRMTRDGHVMREGMVKW